MKDEILYKTEDYSLIKKNNELILNDNKNRYNLESNSYEPCLYIKKDNKIMVIIHNSLTTDELINISINKNKINLINGKDYDIKEICKLIILAINNGIYDTDISYLEKMNRERIDETEDNRKNIKRNLITNINSNILTNTMIELIEDPFYEEYKKYEECVLDYCIVKDNSNYLGEKSHKEVVIFAMEKWKEKYKEKYNILITIEEEKMKSTKIDSKEFFEDRETLQEENKSYSNLFLNPPYGSRYKRKDFEKINNLLFPKGKDNLEIYEWSTNWSNYFEEGLEWWGARCISIYDKNRNRFVVIGASITD